VLSRGPTRTRALKALALGAVALFLLLGDPEILTRFATTVVGSEDRDASAAGRLTFWRAGLLMLKDFPLGAGGGGFKFIYGNTYLARVGAGDEADRSLHNAYLTEATEWGVQGLLLRLLFIGAACVCAHRTSVQCRKEGRANDSLVGICIIAALIGFQISALFGSFFTNEWSFWLIAVLVKYGQLYRVPEAEAVREQPVRAWVPPARAVAASKAG
jgi:O-antigen ligase